MKTRLSCGKIARIFDCKCGSLFQSLKLEASLADLTDLPGQAKVIDSFKPVVSSTDGKVRGSPFGPAMGGEFYCGNAIRAQKCLCHGRFMAPTERIKAASKVGVVTTCSDTWSSRFFVLSDF